LEGAAVGGRCRPIPQTVLEHIMSSDSHSETRPFATASRIGPFAWLVAGLAFATAASANITITFNSSWDYEYRISKVPDLDQIRVGLPNMGNMYCVPASSINWMAYMAQHGYPTLQPGVAAWSNPTNFVAATNAIGNLGTMMGTVADGGTGLDGFIAGSISWLGASGQFNRIFPVGVNDTDSVQTMFADLGQQALLGRLVLPRIGWYDVAEYPAIQRTGGHLASMTRARRTLGVSNWIGLNDPGSTNGNASVQSAFSREDYLVRLDFVFRNGSDVGRLMSQLQGYGTGRIDGWRAYLPAFGLTTSPNGQDLVYNSMVAFGSQSTFSLDAPGSEPMTDLAIAMDQLNAFALIQPTEPSMPTKIVKKNFTFGDIEEFLETEHEVVGLAVSRFGALCYITPTHLHCVNPLDPSRAESVALPGVGAAIAHDDFNDQIVVADIVNHRLYRFADPPMDDFGAPIPPVVVDLPATVELVGTPHMAICRTNGHAWIATDASTTVHEIIESRPATANSFPLPAVDAIMSLQIDNECRILISDGTIKAFGIEPTTGTIVALGVDDSPFVGLVSPGIFRVGLARSNARSGDANDPTEWDIVLPTEFSPSIPDCIADLNGDGVVDGADLGILLTAWGTIGFSDADLNADQLVDGADLGLLLSAWGACPTAFDRR